MQRFSCIYALLNQRTGFNVDFNMILIWILCSIIKSLLASWCYTSLKYPFLYLMNYFVESGRCFLNWSFCEDTAPSLASNMSGALEVWRLWLWFYLVSNTLKMIPFWRYFRALQAEYDLMRQEGKSLGSRSIYDNNSDEVQDPEGSQNPDQEMMAEATLLRTYKERLETRMEILEDHNSRLNSQLMRLRQLLSDQVSRVKWLSGAWFMLG